MAWNDNPKIRGLGDFAKKHRFKAVIAIAIPDNDSDQFEVLTYGHHAELCRRAESIGNEIYEQILDDQPPDLTRLMI